MKTRIASIIIKSILALCTLTFLFDLVVREIFPLFKGGEGWIAVIACILFLGTDIILDMILKKREKEEEEESYEEVEHLRDKFATVDIPQGVEKYKIIEAWTEDDEEGTIQATLELIPRSQWSTRG